MEPNSIMHRPRVNKTGGYQVVRRTKYNKCDDDVKATAVALTKMPGIKAADVAAALCMSPLRLKH